MREVLIERILGTVSSLLVSFYSCCWYYFTMQLTIVTPVGKCLHCICSQGHNVFIQFIEQLIFTLELFCCSHLCLDKGLLENSLRQTCLGLVARTLTLVTCKQHQLCFYRALPMNQSLIPPKFNLR